MSRIQQTLNRLQKQNRKGLVPFVTTGFPSPELTVPVMHAMVEGGADIIELGVPFSDPMADGPVIQHASEVALQKGMTLEKVLDTVEEFRIRDENTPVVLMGYANPIERMGVDVFIREIGRIASGYIYYVSLKGVTGSGNLNVNEVTSRIEKIKKHVTIPVGVGFGIRDAATARALGASADAVVIGSRIIQELESAKPDEAASAVKSFLKEIRKALDE